MKLTHLRLLVTNYKKCFNFYKDVLGLQVRWGDENSGYVDFELDGFKLALFDRQEMANSIGEGNNPIQSTSQDVVAIIFHVDNVDESFIFLKDKGVDFVTEPHDKNSWGIRVAHFRDPDNNLIEINQDLGD